jgi:hypothetical protein
MIARLPRHRARHMKLVRYGKAGKEKPGVLDDKAASDCSEYVETGRWLSQNISRRS